MTKAKMTKEEMRALMHKARHTPAQPRPGWSPAAQPRPGWRPPQPSISAAETLLQPVAVRRRRMR
jgi:hypothetical protein